MHSRLIEAVAIGDFAVPKTTTKVEPSAKVAGNAWPVPGPTGWLI